AGTVFAARVLVMGAGVAGLQAIATARRLGAQVWGYDVRAAVKEQVESLGAKFLEDRKSTRLNSSHVAISYAVFCLKKKKQRIRLPPRRASRLPTCRSRCGESR